MNLRQDILLEASLFSFGILGMALFFKDNLVATIYLSALYGIGAILWHKKHDYIFFTIGAILGPIAEMICVAAGVWNYTNPSILGIPAWLPLAWGLATVFIIRIAEDFIAMKRIKGRE